MGRTAVVPGGRSGNGTALARAPVARGDSVVVAHLDSAGASALAAELSPQGPYRVTAQAGDVRDPEAVGVVVEQAHRRDGRLCMVFNKAGIGLGGWRKRQADAELSDHERTVTRRSPASRVLRVGGLVMALALSSGCYYLMSDPPPPPETAPLEVIATSSMTDETCLLNRYDLGAGYHDIDLISELKPSEVRIREHSGQAVYTGSVGPQVFNEEPQDLPPGSAPTYQTIKLEVGEYTVECEPHGEVVSTAILTVAPARPGYENPPAIEEPHD